MLSDLVFFFSVFFSDSCPSCKSGRSVLILDFSLLTRYSSLPMGCRCFEGWHFLLVTEMWNSLILEANLVSQERWCSKRLDVLWHLAQSLRISQISLNFSSTSQFYLILGCDNSGMSAIILGFFVDFYQIFYGMWISFYCRECSVQFIDLEAAWVNQECLAESRMLVSIWWEVLWNLAESLRIF